MNAPPLGANSPLLQIRGLTKRFGGLTAVNEISFDVREGEILSVIGPNGAGKSTAFKLITGFLRPTSGSVIYGGREIAGIAPHRVARLGVVRTFQETTIFKEMSALQNVVIAHHLRCRAGAAGIFFAVAKAREDERAFADSAAEILNYLGLGSLANEIAKNLPHGHLRALSIAVAMAARPRILLLDEPFAGMNPEETDRASEMIDGIRKLGVTVMLVEHDMRAVMKISDRIVVLNFGTKIAEGTADDIRSDDSVIEAYLGKADDELGV